MSGVVFQVREKSRGNVTGSMLLWATIMAVTLFLIETRWSSRVATVWFGLGATIIFGVYLGWRRRVGAIFVAPFVSWFIAWFPLWIGAMIHYGFFGGLFRGLFLVTIGWLVIGFAEFLLLGAVAIVVRALRGSSGGGKSSFVVFGPDEQP